jgi:hypothetical protein
MPARRSAVSLIDALVGNRNQEVTRTQNDDQTQPEQMEFGIVAWRMLEARKLCCKTSFLSFVSSAFSALSARMVLGCLRNGSVTADAIRCLVRLK